MRRRAADRRRPGHRPGNVSTCPGGRLPLVGIVATKYNAPMLVFVDESGDAGMKLGAGSSDLFILTAVLFQDRDEALRCDERFPAIRAALKLPADYEFHFHQESKKLRCRFFERVVHFGFQYLAVVVEKRRLKTPVYNPAFRFKEGVIKYTAGKLFENAKPYLKDATVVIDASGSREWGNQLVRFLQRIVRDENGYRFIKKIRTARSYGDNLVQLADMVSGALWKAFTHDDGSYRELLSSREARVDVVP